MLFRVLIFTVSLDEDRKINDCLVDISGSSSKTQGRRSFLCSQSFTEESNPEKEGGRNGTRCPRE